MEGAGKAAQFEDILYCTHCFEKKGFAQKQKKVVWTKKENTGGSAIASKFGGGGTKCTICDKTVYTAETVSFDKKAYHSDCFACKTCGKKITPSNAASFEGVIHCSKCFKDGGYSNKQAKASSSGSSGSSSNALASKFGGGGTKCTVCAKTVYAAETVSFDKKPYHSECFKCNTCDKKMTPSGAASFEGTIHCTKCFKEGGYTQKQASTARKTGGGGATNAMASKFGGGGTKCIVCEKTVYAAETVSFEKQAYHAECFKCKHCDKKITPSGAEGKKGEDGFVTTYCKKCWGELGLNRAKVV